MQGHLNVILWHIAEMFLEWEMFYIKVVAKIETLISRSIPPLFFFFENRSIYEIMCKKYGRAGVTTEEHMANLRFTWLPKASKTHSEYVIITAFPLQQWLHERSSMLRHTNSTSRVLL